MDVSSVDSTEQPERSLGLTHISLDGSSHLGQVSVHQRLCWCTVTQD